MQLQTELIDLLQMAYSAEKAAAFAYIGHAGSLKNAEVKKAVNQIETDEWNHRREVLAIMNEYHIPVSKWYEAKFHIIGRTIGASCYVIGWFMPIYFAGRLESGNVCEYIRVKDYFNKLGITKHDEILYEMGVKEKEHENYFLEQIEGHRLLPFFEKVFGWGRSQSFNAVAVNEKDRAMDSVSSGSMGCKTHS
jgi:rubrerythrin